jgi:hypothetical protein
MSHFQFRFWLAFLFLAIFASLRETSYRFPQFAFPLLLPSEIRAFFESFVSLWFNELLGDLCVFA